MGKNPLKNQVKTEHIENKKFVYTKNNVNLSFTLRIDVKNELADFRDLLAKAIEDVDAELEAMSNK